MKRCFSISTRSCTQCQALAAYRPPHWQVWRTRRSNRSSESLSLAPYFRYLCRRRIVPAARSCVSWSACFPWTQRRIRRRDNTLPTTVTLTCVIQTILQRGCRNAVIVCRGGEGERISAVFQRKRHGHRWTRYTHAVDVSAPAWGGCSRWQLRKQPIAKARLCNFLTSTEPAPPYYEGAWPRARFMCAVVFRCCRKYPAHSLSFWVPRWPFRNPWFFRLFHLGLQPEPQLSADCM